MMTAMIRAMESTTISAISPILSPPVSLAFCVSAGMVVPVAVVAIKHHKSCNVTDHYRLSNSKAKSLHYDYLMEDFTFRTLHIISVNLSFNNI